MTATKTKGVSVRNAIALGITVHHLFGSSEGFLGRGRNISQIGRFYASLTHLNLGSAHLTRSAHPMRILPFVALIFFALLAACASEISSPLMGGPFADPGKYEFYSCDQIAANRKSVAAQLEKLKLLMDKAEKGTGGPWSV
jgi:hypothetical protein